MPSIPTRRIGRTDLFVSEVGLGTATIGGSRFVVERATREAVVQAAWDAGLRYVDTAPFYGVGAAEHAVGDVLREYDRDSFVLSSKVGRLLRPKLSREPSPDGRLSPLPLQVVYDYSYDGIMRSVEDSYQRLGLARIDILYVHDIGVYQHGAETNAIHLRTLRDSGYKALDELRRSGVVKAIGIGVNEKEVLIEAQSFGDWDAFLLAGRYTLLEQGPLADLFPLCQARGTSIVVGGPLNSGLLAGRDTWNYDKAPPEIAARAHKLEAVCARHNVALPAAALQFPLAHPLVAAVIPGPRNVEEFQANMAHLQAPIPKALWAELKAENLLDEKAPVPT